MFHLLIPSSTAVTLSYRSDRLFHSTQTPQAAPTTPNGDDAYPPVNVYRTGASIIITHSTALWFPFQSFISRPDLPPAVQGCRIFLSSASQSRPTGTLESKTVWAEAEIRSICSPGGKFLASGDPERFCAAVQCRLRRKLLRRIRSPCLPFFALESAPKTR